jgi:GTP-binding protein HflX
VAVRARRRQEKRRDSILHPERIEKLYLAGWAPSRKTLSSNAAREQLAEDSMQELQELVLSAGASVVGAQIQHSPEPDPATLIGRGKVQEIRSFARACGAACVAFCNDLSPTQLRNLESALDLKVIDRTQIILDIFARRARTREGKLQVELAQLTYLLPRLSGRGTLLSRLGGGIGTRGPGEQQLEFDRRRVRARIQKLTEALDRVRSQRSLHRVRRREQEFLTVALVGYTNAGKSTLFNALTGASAGASSRMFSTLDPMTRALPLESGRKVVLADTVGFIRHLPPHLVSAFRATLEELDTADLLLHVTDASHPESGEHDRAVEQLLDSLGLATTPRLHVWNKVDLLPPPALHRLPESANDVAVSASTGQGIPQLLQRIDNLLVTESLVEDNFEFSIGEGDKLALLHRSGKVVATRFLDRRVLVRVRLKPSVRARLLSTFGEGRNYPSK